ncbi:MAG TPA: hypothetical protein VMV12_05400 [Candidatus Micrarchaeaceae archaeon]|nr:hypothetical protein [Candidatus Micrarchaeaceae archaeon]
MSNSIKHFLLVFDHEKGALVETFDFGSDGERAVAAYSAKEKECEDNPAMEIVLIGSDSFETVQFTHANYFDGSAGARLKSPYLAGV